ncbi:hypothetical protein N7456_010877 [Penicillium angulare]|uniref:Uncharacterized protein n=1 Tax=Penicillium angulare TaxID=116970 RepID=A0A9W9ESQ4_9EURO|nr:hypothetical protein N7456_010877 [Penicillium angulare]
MKIDNTHTAAHVTSNVAVRTYERTVTFRANAAWSCWTYSCLPAGAATDAYADVRAAVSAGSGCLSRPPFDVTLHCGMVSQVV